MSITTCTCSYLPHNSVSMQNCPQPRHCKNVSKQQKRGGFAKTRLRGDKTVACYFSFIDLSTLNSPSFFPCSPFSQRSVDDEQ